MKQAEPKMNDVHYYLAVNYYKYVYNAFFANLILTIVMQVQTVS